MESEHDRQSSVALPIPVLCTVSSEVITMSLVQQDGYMSEYDQSTDLESLILFVVYETLQHFQLHQSMLLVPRQSIHVPSEHLRVTMQDLVDEMLLGHVMEVTDERMRVVQRRMLHVMHLHVIQVMVKMDELVTVLHEELELSTDQAHMLKIQMSVVLHSMYEYHYQQM